MTRRSKGKARYVRIDRPDGSRSYVGPFSGSKGRIAEAQGEATARRAANPEAVVAVLEVTDEVLADVRRYDRAAAASQRAGGPADRRAYYPDQAAERAVR